MDWQALAQQVVAVLVPIAPALTLAATEAWKALSKQFGEAGAKAALAKGKALWDRLKSRFGKDKEVTQTMDLFANNPQAFETALSKVLAQRLAQDEAFGRQLAGLLREAVSDGEVATFLTQVYGQARVSKIVNVGQIDADEVHF
jgi:hypothetical protein